MGVLPQDSSRHDCAPGSHAWRTRRSGLSEFLVLTPSPICKNEDPPTEDERHSDPSQSLTPNATPANLASEKDHTVTVDPDEEPQIADFLAWGKKNRPVSGAIAQCHSPTSWPELLRAAQGLRSRIGKMPSLPQEQLIQANQSERNFPLEQALLEECGCEKLSCRATCVVLSGERSYTYVASHAFEMAHSRLQSKTEQYEELQKQFQELVEMIKNPHMDPIQALRPGAGQVAEMRMNVRKAANDHDEIVWLRKEVERLEPQADMVATLEKENDTLKSKVNGMKHEIGRARAGMKASGVQQLRSELHAANAKITNLQSVVRELKDQLSQSQAREAVSTSIPGPLNHDGEAIELKRFGLSSQAYAKESARLLDYLEKMQIEVLTRAQGITDRNGSGWSAYERLEGLIGAAQSRSSQAIRLVLNLDRDAEREVRLDSQGFPMLNVKKSAGKK